MASLSLLLVNAISSGVVRRGYKIPANNKGGSGVEARIGAAFLAKLGLLSNTQLPEVVSHIGYVFDIEDIDRGIFLQIALDLGNDSLAGRQIARAQQHQRPFVGDGKAVHFAISADPVRSGVGPRIGAKYQALVQGNGKAICHLG